MRVLTYLTILILTFNACSTDRSEQTDWTKCKQQKSMQTLFNYALNHVSSEYLDSALIILNDSIKQDSYCYLSYNEDSNSFFKGVMTNYSIQKDHIFLIDINSGNCLFNDTLITAKDSINQKLDWFMQLGFKHFVWVYSDSISSRKSWISLFGEISKIIDNYKSLRERYSINKWQIEYGKLGTEKQKLVKEKIPINLMVFFANPNPPPPHLIHEQTEILNQRNKILLVTNAIANAGMRVR